MNKKIFIVSLILMFIFMFSLVEVEAFSLFDLFRRTETITLWDIRTPEDPARAAVEDAIARFEEDHDNIEIEHVPIQNDDYKTRLSVAAAADDEPDIFMTWGGGGLKNYVDEGMVYDITAYLEEDNWRDNFLDAAMNNSTFEGKTYGVPVTNVAPAVIWYREDMFAEYDLTPPETYEELLEIIEVFKENDIVPFTLANQNRWPGSMYYMYFVDRLAGPEVYRAAVSPDMAGSFTDEPFIEAGQMIRDLVEMDAFPAGLNAMNEDDGDSRTMLYTKDAGMYLMGSWAYSTIGMEDEITQEQLNFFPFPSIEGADGTTSGIVGTVGDNFYSVAEKCENKEMAVEFLRYLTDEKAKQELLAVGNIPPISGVADDLDDPMLQSIFRVVEEAESSQLWYDQDLPPEIAQVHLNQLQGLFGGDVTPEEKAQAMADAIEDYYAD